MAKRKARRTYHDPNGYKRKKKKRGTPEFATVEEYNAHIAAKKRAALNKNPIKAVPILKQEILSRLEELEARLSDPFPPSDEQR